MAASLINFQVLNSAAFIFSGELQVLTAGANWAAEPIRGRRRLTVLTVMRLIKAGRPAETQFETLVCKHIESSRWNSR